MGHKVGDILVMEGKQNSFPHNYYEIISVNGNLCTIQSFFDMTIYKDIRLYTTLLVPVHLSLLEKTLYGI